MVDSPGTPVCTNTVYANSGCWIPGPGVPGSLVPAFRILRSTGYNVTKLGILRANGFVISAITLILSQGFNGNSCGIVCYM